MEGYRWLRMDGRDNMIGSSPLQASGWKDLPNRCLLLMSSGEYWVGGPLVADHQR